MVNQIELQARKIEIKFDHNNFDVWVTVYLGKDYINWETHYDSISMMGTLDDKIILIDASISLGDLYYVNDGMVMVQDAHIHASRLSITPVELCKQVERMIKEEEKEKLKYK